MGSGRATPTLVVDRRDVLDAVGTGPRDVADRDRLWDLIVEEYQPRLINFARSRGVTDPDDVAQDVLAVAAEKLGGFTGTWSDFRAWLFTIAYRRVADHYRAAGRRRMLSVAAAPEAGDRLDPALHVTEAETCEEALAALVDLTDRERTVITMRLFDELTAEEVGDKLGMTPSHVRVVQTRAVAKLRASLAPRVLDRARLLLGPAALGAAAGDRSPSLWARLLDRIRTTTGEGSSARRMVASLDRGSEAVGQLALGPAAGAVTTAAALLVGVASTFGPAVAQPVATRPPAEASVTTPSVEPLQPTEDEAPARRGETAATTASTIRATTAPSVGPAGTQAETEADPAPAPADGPSTPPEPGTGVASEGSPTTTGSTSPSTVAGVGAGVGVDIGTDELGADVGADVDLSIDGSGDGLDADVGVSAGTGVTAGAVSGRAAADVDAAVEAGAEGIGVVAGTDATIGVGSVGVDLGVDVEVGLGGDGVNLDLDLGLGLPRGAHAGDGEPSGPSGDLLGSLLGG